MKRLCLLALALCPLFTGCYYRRHYVVYDPAPSVCSEHVHGPDCGHAYVDGVWGSTGPSRVVYVEERYYRPSPAVVVGGAVLGAAIFGLRHHGHWHGHRHDHHGHGCR
jgi:hypothetical protein